MKETLIYVEQTFEEADVKIINAAIEQTLHYVLVVTVGENIDLLILFIGLALLCCNIYFKQPEPEECFINLYGVL